MATTTATTTTSTSWRRRRRRAMLLPPAPVTPFRGGLRPIASTSSSGGGKTDAVAVASSTTPPEEGEGDGSSGRGVGFGSRSSSSSSSSPSSSSPATAVADGGATTSTTSTVPSSSWAPEDYPNPWTNPGLCMGAASSSSVWPSASYYDAYGERQGPYLRQRQPQQPQQRQGVAASSSSSTPLFCDPDRVLDGETIRDVVARLRSFASSTISSGGGGYAGDGWSVAPSAERGGDVGAGAEGLTTATTTTNNTTGSNDEVDDGGAEEGAEDDAEEEDRMVAATKRYGSEVRVEAAVDTSSWMGAWSIPPRLSHDDGGGSPSSSSSSSSSSSTSSFAEGRLYSDAVGGIFSPIIRAEDGWGENSAPEWESAKDERIEIAIALVERVSIFVFPVCHPPPPPARYMFFRSLTDRVDLHVSIVVFNS
jgi:hypothetical protein